MKFWFSQKFFDSEANMLLGGSRYVDPNNKDQIKFGLAVVNFEKQKSRLIDVGFLPHGIIADPINLQRLVTFEKIGPGAAVVDLRSMRETAKLTTPPERVFYGHGAFSSDGKLLYATETYLNSGEGVIIVRDGKSMKIVDEFPTFGNAPHECQIVDNGRTMAVTNGGGKDVSSTPNVAFIDIAAQTLIKQEPLTNSALNTGHFALGEEDSLIVVSAPRETLKNPKLGGVSIKPAGKKLKSITSPRKVVADMVGEALSVAVHNNTAVVTHPFSNMLTIWSMEDRRFIKRVDIPAPRGVTLNKEKTHFMVSYDHAGTVGLLDLETLSMQNDSLCHDTNIAGSHLYNYADLTAAR